MQFSLWDAVHNSELTSYYVTKVRTEYNRILSLLSFSVQRNLKSFLSQEEFNLENPNIYDTFYSFIIEKTS